MCTFFIRLTRTRIRRRKLSEQYITFSSSRGRRLIHRYNFETISGTLFHLEADNFFIFLTIKDWILAVIRASTLAFILSCRLVPLQSWVISCTLLEIYFFRLPTFESFIFLTFSFRLLLPFDLEIEDIRRTVSFHRETSVLCKLHDEKQ